MPCLSINRRSMQLKRYRCKPSNLLSWRCSASRCSLNRTEERQVVHLAMSMESTRTITTTMDQVNNRWDRWTTKCNWHRISKDCSIRMDSKMIWLINSSCLKIRTKTEQMIFKRCRCSFLITYLIRMAQMVDFHRTCPTCSTTSRIQVRLIWLLVQLWEVISVKLVTIKTFKATSKTCRSTVRCHRMICWRIFRTF